MPEAPRILEAETAAVKGHARVNVRERHVALALREEPAPAHAEVGEERCAALELEDQELAETRNAADRAAFEVARELAGEGLAELEPRKPHRADRAPDEVRLEHAAHGLDFGEFGHVETLEGSVAEGQGLGVRAGSFSRCTLEQPSDERFLLLPSFPECMKELQPFPSDQLDSVLVRVLPRR